MIIFCVKDESQHLEMPHLSDAWESLKIAVLSILHCIFLLNFPSVKNLIITLLSNVLEAKRTKWQGNSNCVLINYDFHSSRKPK